MVKHYTRCLTIAGSDSGGGAGIQADLKTFAALGCYGLTAMTAVTAQNTHSVSGVYPLPPAVVAQQINAVVEDIGVNAVKIGMLFSSEIIDIVAERIRHYGLRNIIVDPVMIAKGGDNLLRPDAITALGTLLFPVADVITPNIPEAESLTGIEINDSTSMELAARSLLDFGPKAVVIKGGHSIADSSSSDCLVLADDDRTYWVTAPRIDTRNTHGTGCTFSSAITAFRAKGLDIQDSVREAKSFVSRGIEAGSKLTLGSGHGPLHHFFSLWDDQ